MPKTEPFEKHSDWFDEWFDTHRDTYLFELDAVRQLIPPSPSKGIAAGYGKGAFVVVKSLKR